MLPIILITTYAGIFATTKTALAIGCANLTIVTPFQRHASQTLFNLRQVASCIQLQITATTKFALVLELVQVGIVIKRLVCAHQTTHGLTPHHVRKMKNAPVIIVTLNTFVSHTTNLLKLYHT